MSNLSGKVAMVTGAGQGMGRAISQKLAACGATVIAVDVNLAAAQQSLDEVGAKGLATTCDIADSQAVEAMFAKLAEQYPCIDILVNNAGVGAVDSFTETTDESWARVVGVNLTGAFYISRAAVKLLQAREQAGSIIHISSSAAQSGDGPCHYVASKAAVIGLARSMARELAPSNIRVNCVVPGPTRTPMMENIPDEWNQAIVAGVPMGRMAEPAEIADAVAFLAGPDAGFITGQCLAVNGGSVFL